MNDIVSEVSKILHEQLRVEQSVGDNTAWIEVLSQNGGLSSFRAFMGRLEENAKIVAMSPQCSETTWRAAQAYYKWCQDVRLFINNFIGEREANDANSTS